CHARTLLHAMVAREGKLPAQPGRWEIVDEHTIRQWPHGGPLLDAVRLTDASLQRALGAFRVDRSYLLQNGLQEFLLEPGAPSLPPSVAGCRWASRNGLQPSVEPGIRAALAAPVALELARQPLALSRRSAGGQRR